MLKGKIQPIGSKVFVKSLEKGERVSASGIVMANDTGTENGIRDRWAQVFAVGPDVYDLSPGNWILIEHGRWSEGIDYTFDDGIEGKIWLVDYPKAVSIASDEFPHEYDFTK